MGRLSDGAGVKELARQQRGNRLGDLLASQWPKIAAVMPRHMSQERLFQMAVSAYNTTPKLAECSVQSVLSCVMKCAALGMEPSSVDGLGRAYILPFWNGKTRQQEATFILGYKGMLDLARRSGEIESISARAVREGDEFSYSYGLHEDLVHVPSSEPKEGRRLTHAYCIARFKDGGYYFVVLTEADIETAKRSSKSATGRYADSSPWATHTEEMWVKTAVRRAFPYLPVSIEAQEGAAADDTTPDYSEVLSAPVVEQVPVVETVPAVLSEPAVDYETGEVLQPEQDDGQQALEIAEEG